jgi:phosphate transport system substrate-binding protein
MAVTVAVSLLVAACGSDNNKSSTPTTQAATVACAPGTITGAGSTFVANLVQQWSKDYSAKCPGATISYQGGGSSAGITQFSAGTVDFGASDAVMTAAEEQTATAKGGKVLHIPWAAGPVAIEYNLSGVKGLKLSGETLASILVGKVKTWNDKMIAADNSGVSLPSTPIQVVHRSDGSGTTNALSGYLYAVAPTIWTYPPSKNWPQPTPGVKGSDQVTASVKQSNGAIGYAELSYAKGAGLEVVSVKNAAGNFTPPSPKASQAALAEAQVPADLKIVPNYKPTAPDAYPITTATFALVFAKPADPAKGKLLKDFLLYAVGPGQASSAGLDYAPLPTSLQQQDKAAVESMQA